MKLLTKKGATVKKLTALKNIVNVLMQVLCVKLIVNVKNVKTLKIILNLQTPILK